MKQFLASIVHCLLWSMFLMVDDMEGVIVSPCKVRNFLAQPEYGTSLKTKDLIRIVQIPPAFVQNVMVGICENREEDISTGRMGEFYSCQQRYSVVEVYTAESSTPTMEPYHQAPPSDNPNNPYDIRFIRESVIIESGCDFTFNLLPLIADAQAPPTRPSNYATPQQKMFLQSPFHQIQMYRQPPMGSVPVTVPQTPQGVPVDPNDHPQYSSTVNPAEYDNHAYHPDPADAHGRAVEVEVDDALEMELVNPTN